MTQTLPSANEAPAAAPVCSFGSCTRPATHHVVITYPATPDHRAFDWTGDYCTPDLNAERATAVRNAHRLTATPLEVTA